MGWFLFAFSMVIMIGSLLLAHSLPNSPLHEMERLLTPEHVETAGGRG